VTTGLRAAQIRAALSHPIIDGDGHWMESIWVTERDFREFTFTNAARLHTRNNPDFFKGTAIEQAVAAELGLSVRPRKAQATA